MDIQPRSLDDLTQAVERLSRQGTRIRAVGALHSFSAVNETDGTVVRTHRLTERLPLGPVRGGWDAAALVRVGCGCSVQGLQRMLQAEGRMLANTPAFTAQTLGGAVSTASHGTGRGLGSLADLVVSVDLVRDGGEVLRVEASDGPTDPRRYDGALVQDDRWFHSVVVGLGAFGVHAAYTLRTEPLLHLHERRFLTTLPEALSVLLEAESRHVGLLFSPYPDPQGVHWACVTERRIGRPARGTERLALRQRLWPLLFSQLPIDRPILAACARKPERRVPWMLRQALAAPVRERYVAPAPVVLDNFPLNQAAAAHAFEASLPEATLWAAIDAVIARARTEAEQGRYLTGPVAVRTVAGSSHLLAPTHARDSVVLEVISLHRSPWGRDVLVPFAWDLDALGGRPHFGLDVLTVSHRRDLERLYPGFPTWAETLDEIDPTGRFDNPLLDRLDVRGRAAAK